MKRISDLLRPMNCLVTRKKVCAKFAQLNFATFTINFHLILIYEGTFHSCRNDRNEKQRVDRFRAFKSLYCKFFWPLHILIVESTHSWKSSSSSRWTWNLGALFTTSFFVTSFSSSVKSSLKHSPKSSHHFLLRGKSEIDVTNPGLLSHAFRFGPAKSITNFRGVDSLKIEKWKFRKNFKIIQWKLELKKLPKWTQENLI